MSAVQGAGQQRDSGLAQEAEKEGHDAGYSLMLKASTSTTFPKTVVSSREYGTMDLYNHPVSLSV